VADCSVGLSLRVGGGGCRKLYRLTEQSRLALSISLEPPTYPLLHSFSL
jgi:hypothetical protein